MKKIITALITLCATITVCTQSIKSNRINKSLSWAVTFMFFFWILPLHAKVVSYSGVKYEVNGSYAKVLGPTSKNVSTIEIYSLIEVAYVTEIADDAFIDCQNLITVTIDLPQNYDRTRICGKRAFYNCKKLKKVTVEPGNSPISLGESAFEGCSELETIDGMRELILGRKCFRNCSKLEYSYADWPFYYKVSKLTVPARAFENCKRITGFKLSWYSNYTTYPVTEIGEYAFAGTGIEQLELPESITYIGSGAFAKCENLSRLEISEKIKTNLDCKPSVNPVLSA